MVQASKFSKERAKLRAKQVTKAAKLGVLTELCNQIVQAKAETGRIPYGLVSKLVSESKTTFPWITRNMINNHYRRIQQKTPEIAPLPPQEPCDEFENNPSLVSDSSENSEDTKDVTQTQPPPPIMTIQRARGGRAKGDTKDKRKKCADAIIAARNEITMLFCEELKKKKCKRKTRVAKGVFDLIVKDVKRRRNLPDTFQMSYYTARQRIMRNKIFCDHKGHTSPLISIEKAAVTTIIQMCRIRQSLSPSQGVALVNAMIGGGEEQHNLIEWKKRNSHYNEDVTVLGQVGPGYWAGFMRRNGHLIESTRGQKYELDRSSWTTYTNFNDMYKHNYREMANAGVAKVLDSPVWMDIKGNIVEEADAYGCKCSHELTHPGFCIVMDEVGGNTSMTGDGHIGGEKYLCEKGVVAQLKAARADKHFTVLGVTLLNGIPLMCVVIFAGKKCEAKYELGVDPRAEVVGDLDDEDFVVKNMGDGMLFPGGPTCTYNGKKIPCMCRWSPKGSITSEILTDILRTLDAIEVFDRSTGITPVVLMDGHGSRLGLPFLNYVNDPTHPWCVDIGVPYGTSLWQVGDSPEQNGSYKMALARIKKKLIEWKQRKMIGRLTIEVSEIMVLINYAWEHSFARVSSNKTAIAVRGWFPLNRRLLLDNRLRATMTEKEKSDEGTNGIIIPYHETNSFFEIDDDLPTLDVKYLPSPPPPLTKPNLSGGMAAYCLDAIVQNQDLMDARERIRQNRIEGESVSDRLNAIKRMTSAKMFLLGKTKLGEDIRDNARKNYNEHEMTQAANKVKAINAYREMVNDYNSVMALNLDPQQWNVSQLKKVLKPLKKREDPAMPSRKADLYALYLRWQSRKPSPIEEVTAGTAPLDGQPTLTNNEQPTPSLQEQRTGFVDELRPDYDDFGSDDQEECIEAMLLLNSSLPVAEI